jgi:hypothetical protein
MPTRNRNPLGLLLGVFSSVWTGVILLTMLFFYSAVGSAGLWSPQTGHFHLRQLPAFEMTEFEWFCWWPFNLMIGLICVTLITTTLRRIRFKPVNYGVWMIHSGIIVLAIGCFIYFGTKVEGDAPVVRRQITVTVPGAAPVSMIAMPGNSVEVGPPERPYRLRVASIDPEWEILSGDDAGKRTYSVNVLVESRDQVFMRQLLAGYPQYTEDLIPATDPGPPWARAKKVTGNAIVDDKLILAIEYSPEPWFYLSNDIVKSWALYLREVPVDGPAGPWIERPIDGLPLYNDYVADLNDVWTPAGGTSVPKRPLHVAVEPVDPADPLPDVTLNVNSYLRYAVTETRRRKGGAIFDPVVRVGVISTSGRGQDYQLVALDPVERMEPGGRLVFEWMDTEADFDELLEVRAPMLTIAVPETSMLEEFPIRNPSDIDPILEFTRIEGTAYEWRVQNLHDGLQLPTGEVISVAVVEIRTPQRSWVRWVSDDPTKTRDLPDDDIDMAAAHGQSLPLEEGIVMGYKPRVGPAPITIAAGPAEDQLRLVLNFGPESPRIEPLEVGRPVSVSDSIALTVSEYSAYTTIETRPAIVAMRQRNKDVRARMSMIQVEMPDGWSSWLRFHHWPFNDTLRSFGLAMFEPTRMELPDGRRVEFMFSRQRRALPAPVVLDDFEMQTHTGGYSGQNISVLNWTSQIRFRQDDGWSDVLAVSVNDPRTYGGLSYFQAQWDPPDPERGYAGLNYTVLGVGNRHGVNIMLLGCCVSVLGMIYAFYVKPFIKRKQRLAVYAQVAAERREAGDAAAARPGGAVAEPVAAMEEQS